MQTESYTESLTLSNGTPLDLDRCRRGMAQISISGYARPALIEEAIRRIQDDPTGALKKEYVGIKNYASFGDQREDHSYGRGPRHGDIVFSIGRHDPEKALALDADAVYYLEAYRDFSPMKWVDVRAQSQWERERALALGEVIAKFDALAKECERFSATLTAARVHAHSTDASEVRR